MFGFRKSPAHKASNPSASDTESDKNLKLGRRTSSEPMLITPNSKPNPFDDDDDHGRRVSATASSSLGSRNKHKKGSGYSDSEDFDSMSVQELESYAVNKAEDTTKSVTNCLKIAEDIRQDATRTLDTLHQQGEQIHRTHMMAADMDKDLSKGEKLLGNLGGMFSMPWKAKKTREILLGLQPQKQNKEQREKLGLAPAPKARSAPRTPPSEPTNALQKVEVEKAKQDDALSDLSNILGDLKGMAVDMGTELNKQNKALDHLHDDVEELNSRVKGANQRARRLIGK
ncbi:soluble N-ethylmaleimide-sensitive factor adaptor protein 30 [Actinidia rufa]|uniref:Soluble N-ethylmaleimide-sensitive factor adaptor protein 30 n=1 Tax=Actinidia rufa TaxID=165716 RepID=A0A7J0EQ01_9ERIC|nr:soluble N-ethylmaleimide-sensitive factor adaptor protein 30 [Actinidia rufa]